MAHSHTNKTVGSWARQLVTTVLSSQYQPALTRQMAEPFVFLLSSIFWLEPARRNVLKTRNTIRKNLSWKLTHSNCPVINTFSASQTPVKLTWTQFCANFNFNINTTTSRPTRTPRGNFRILVLRITMRGIRDCWSSQLLFCRSRWGAWQWSKWDDLITPFPGVKQYPDIWEWQF